MKLQLKKAQPSLLGFGCMRLPLLAGGRPSDIDYAAAKHMIDYAYAHGVNYFDTAYPYHEQKSEDFVGYALSEYPRESYYLADKLPGWFVKTKEDVDKIFNTQLKRCQTEYFDFYLCHALSREDFKLYENLGIYDILKEKKAKGQIKNLGFSFHDTPEALAYIADKYEWDFVQLQINYLDWERQEAKRQYEILRERKLPCIVMEPVRGGALAKLCPEALKVLHEADPSRSAASWALRYAGSLPGILTVLSGMTTFEQVEDNVKTMMDFKPLETDEYETLQMAKSLYLKLTTVPCTGCRYCMDCPSGVDIPKLFSIYNDYKISGYGSGFKSTYKALGSAGADSCIGCGKCMEHCPQSIKIPELMEQIREAAAAL